ncbi:Response regulator receiver domain protein CheY [Nostoc sp. NIES-3756]|uniref:response regulator n=1 Tax=Nostoc sp. NIES-3756 TaxID=1751286 RepID=UPI000720A4DC|nr:response regulator [Nostoc sp. NIES-3756]BAT54142.1 Response regulator receiver domain protein CheY [Nostoc sp. NIES-3756]BAY38118.1 response regulator receiver domain protein [Nostoc sp. NIES-2111]
MSNSSEKLHSQNITDTYNSLDGLHILVVDDNADSLFLTTCVLESYGIQVTTATSATEALETVKQLKFDMLIFDIAMPDMDGFTLVNQIRNNILTENRNIPAIALTALGSEEDYNMALKSGFQGYVNKPLDPNILTEEILKLVGSSVVGNGVNSY